MLGFKKSDFLALIPFFVFLGLLPYKLLGLFQVEYSIRLFVGGIFFCIFLKTFKGIIPFFFNSPFIQLLFFYFISFEDYIQSRSIKYQLFLGITLGFNLGAWPSQTNDPLFWYLLMGLFFSLYFNFKRIFLNPEFEANIYGSDQELNLENLSWEQIHKNMNNISVVLFGLPINNHLSQSLSKKSFPEVSKRYMWSRIGRTVQRYADSFGGGAAFGGVLGFGISEYRNQARHNEAMAKQQEANELAREQQEKLKQEALDIARRKAKELDPSHPPKGWLWDSLEDSFSHNILKIFTSFF